MRQGHAFLPQNVCHKNVEDMRRKTSIYVRFAVRTFCGVTGRSYCARGSYPKTYGNDRKDIECTPF
jgi:hypothetical protein